MIRKALLLTVTAISAIGCANAQPCKSVLVEPTRALTVQQIGQLADRTVSSASRFTVMLWSFDVEDRPRKGGLRGVAFVLVTNGDLGAKPVGAVIWAAEPEGADFQTESDRDVVRISVRTARSTCTQTPVSIRVATDGVVSADAVVLGKIE